MTPTVLRVPLRTGLEYEVLEWAPRDPACDHTVLLLHGYLDLAWGWQPVVDAGLAGRWHILAPSFRGHGQSDWIGAGGTYYFLDYVADLASLVASHARDRLSVVGHSMGGMAASFFTGTYPERVEKLALLEGFSVPESQTGPTRMRDAVDGRAAALEKRGTQAQPGSRRFASLEEAALRMRHHDAELDDAHAMALATRGCLQLPSGQWVFRHDPLLQPRTPVGFELPIASRFWANIACDVLYVEGASSAFKLGDEERALRLGALRSVRHVCMPGAGHMMIRHQASEVARLLGELLGPAVA